MQINSSNRRYELAGAVKQLSDAAVAAEGGGVILSVFAGSPAAGVEALRAWVSALDLPAFNLEGLDPDGVSFSRTGENGESVPLDMDGFGATLLMYHSKQNGLTTLMSYGGAMAARGEYQGERSARLGRDRLGSALPLGQKAPMSCP